MWIDSWTDLGRVLAVGTAAYLSLIVVLRVSGKRTLAELDAFDFVVTVALGSTLDTIVLNTSVSWADGATALALLAALQLIVAWLRSRLPPLGTVAEPTCPVKDGVLFEGTLRAQRATRTEVYQAVRGTGTGAIDDVAAVVSQDRRHPVGDQPLPSQLRHRPHQHPRPTPRAVVTTACRRTPRPQCRVTAHPTDVTTTRRGAEFR